MTEQNELAKVLAALDEMATPPYESSSCADAARLLRALAIDFARYVEHPRGCDASDYWVKEHRRACSCGLDAARVRWRLLQ